MTTLNTLPDELFDLIYVSLGRRELWTVLQVSSRFRRLALFPYLARFGITQTTIQSGTLTLSHESLFLVLVVERLHPIQRLIYNEALQLEQYERFVSLVSAAAPIPDIVVCTGSREQSRHAGYILSNIPSSATGTLLIVNASTPWGSAIYLSHPRRVPNASRVTSLKSARKWVDSALFKRPGPPDQLISRENVGHGDLAFDESLRIQTLLGNELILATLANKSPSSILAFRRVAKLPPALYSHILPFLDYGAQIVELWFDRKLRLTYGAVAAFIQRQASLTRLSLSPDSILLSSLSLFTVLPNPESKIHSLSAPSIYIPSLLPMAPNASTITICPSLTPTLLPHLRGPAIDLPAYRAALEAVAALPGTQPLSLHLCLHPYARALPWRAAAAAHDDPHCETRLARVTTLYLSSEIEYFPNGKRQLRKADLRSPAFLRWLALFPGLKYLAFAAGSLEEIESEPERDALVEACAACAGIDSDGGVNLYWQNPDTITRAYGW
ncbi:hypothetical protein C8R46DRAFT_1067525 [Mycena filopes]|nr:hypothetical protein C8R46DRAFT_1067525 [Mycena filopes]